MFSVTGTTIFLCWPLLFFPNLFGLPCIFQHVSLVCRGLLQKLHHKVSLFFGTLLRLFVVGTTPIILQFLEQNFLKNFSPSSHPFFLLHRRWSNTSIRDGSVSLFSTKGRSCSYSWLRPLRNSKIRSLSIIFEIITKSSGHANWRC